jgi:GT2 family glycosyltransferase
MDLSIIIINYNTFDMTCQCIRSIQQQVQGITYEIVLVDNGSAEEGIPDFLDIFPDIVLIKNENNEGFSKGVNIGIVRSSGGIVLLINSDTVFQNDAASICLKYLEENKQVAVVGAALFCQDGQVQHNCQRFPSIRFTLFELFRLQKVFPKRVGGKILLGFFFDHDEIVYTDWIWGTFFMFRKSILKELNGGHLADDFFMYVEDVQWCMEFKLLGYKIAFVPQARVIHFSGQSQGAKSSLISTNMEIFMKRYYRFYERWTIAVLAWLLVGWKTNISK